MSLTLAKVFRNAYDLLADDIHKAKLIISTDDDGNSRRKEKLDNDLLLNRKNDYNNKVTETALLIDFKTEISRNRIKTWVREYLFKGFIKFFLLLIKRLSLYLYLFLFFFLGVF